MTISDKVQPLGPLVVDASAIQPGFEPHFGRSVRLEPIAQTHVMELWESATAADLSWTYLRYGPFLSEQEMRSHISGLVGLHDQPFFAIIPATSGCAEGWVSYCDISRANSSIEIGSIWFSPRLQQTRAGTEAMFLMLDSAFALGFHRVVWRCNALNAASVRAAKRLGFTYEGTWREAEIAKGRRRNTAWFSILKSEWPRQKSLFDAWLADDNFDEAGKARTSLMSSGA